MKINDDIRVQTHSKKYTLILSIKGKREGVSWADTITKGENSPFCISSICSFDILSFSATLNSMRSEDVGGNWTIMRIRKYN